MFSEEKSGMGAHFFNEKKLLGLENDDIGQEDHVEDVKLDGPDMSTCEKKNGVWIVLQKHRLEVLCQHHDSYVAGYWRRYVTQELVS